MYLNQLASATHSNHPGNIIRHLLCASFVVLAGLCSTSPISAQATDRGAGPRPDLFEVPAIRSSWDDLTEGVQNQADWRQRRARLKQRYLELLRDQHKPDRPPRDLKVHEETVVDGVYRRQLISYAVESDERTHAYLGIPLKLNGKAPAVVALHGTYAQGNQRRETAG